MPAEQLCFFKFPRPLVELMGADFFKSAPAAPGVYLFRGEARRVLYVGQSKNLRLRLGYYKNAQPEREPRRVIRLVHQTRAIELEICLNTAEAQEREIALIQQHRPRFNVQHAHSRAYSFFGLRAEGPRAALRLSTEPAPQPGETLTGAFKNRGLCRRAMFAAARVLWRLERQPKRLEALPMPLLDRPRLNELPVPASSVDELAAWIRGESRGFLDRAAELEGQPSDPFLQRILEQDRAVLDEFAGLAERMRRLRERAGVTGLLAQEDLDRWQLGARRAEAGQRG